MATAKGTTKGASAKDLLSNLTAGKKVATSTAKVSRPELPLPESLVRTFKRFIGAHALCEIVEARKDQERQMLDDGCFQEWTARLWKDKSRPANPTVKIDNAAGKLDMSATFQVQQRYVVKMDDVEGQEPTSVVTNSFIEQFVDTGMDVKQATEAATKIVTDELDFTPKTTIDFSRLVNGHFEGEGKNRTWVDATEAEQAIASKVINFVNCRSSKELAKCELLTEVEASQLIQLKHSVVVKPNFLQRVCTYVHSLDQLRAVFNIIKPVKAVSQVDFAASDTPEERNRRLFEESKDILGIK